MLFLVEWVWQLLFCKLVVQFLITGHLSLPALNVLSEFPAVLGIMEGIAAKHSGVDVLTCILYVISHVGFLMGGGELGSQS